MNKYLSRPKRFEVATLLCLTETQVGEIVTSILAGGLCKDHWPTNRSFIIIKIFEHQFLALKKVLFLKTDFQVAPKKVTLTQIVTPCLPYQKFHFFDTHFWQIDRISRKHQIRILPRI